MNIIKRVKVLRVVRGLIIFITAGVSARMPAAVTMGSRRAIAVEVSARGKRVILRDDEIQHLKVWMRTQIPAYGDLVERWEKYAEDARSFAHIKIGDAHYRTATTDRNKRTVHSYFRTFFVNEEMDRDGNVIFNEKGEPKTDEIDRHGRITQILRVEIAGEMYTLL
eukprot:gene21614-25997_t